MRFQASLILIVPWQIFLHEARSANVSIMLLAYSMTSTWWWDEQEGVLHSLPCMCWLQSLPCMCWRLNWQHQQFRVKAHPAKLLNWFGKITCWLTIVTDEVDGTFLHGFKTKFIAFQWLITMCSGLLIFDKTSRNLTHFANFTIAWALHNPSYGAGQPVAMVPKQLVRCSFGISSLRPGMEQHKREIGMRECRSGSSEISIIFFVKNYDVLAACRSKWLFWPQKIVEKKCWYLNDKMPIGTADLV